jgi:branched-chain amino acid aminotransferase
MAYILDGTYISEDRLCIHPANRGLRYGEGLFETMRWRDDRVLFFSHHMERLRKGMAFLDMGSSTDLISSLPSQIKRLCTAYDHLTSARVRLNVFRGEGNLYDTAPVHYLLEVAWEPERSWQSFEGLSLGIYPGAQRGLGPLANFKTNNYLASVLGIRYAHAHGWDEALLLNVAGRVSESTIANLFVIRENILYTPPLEEGCVAGVIRRQLLECLPARGLSVKESALSLEQVQQADEVFLTNALRGVRPVARLGDISYGSQLTGHIAAILEETTR